MLVAPHIYFNPKKWLHPYYVQIGNSKADKIYYRGTFATLDEAIKVRDEFIQYSTLQGSTEPTKML
jgi:hypothetical protein